jgi:hypothetical protein
MNLPFSPEELELHLVNAPINSSYDDVDQSQADTMSGNVSSTSVTQPAIPGGAFSIDTSSARLFYSMNPDEQNSNSTLPLYGPYGQIIDNDPIFNWPVFRHMSHVRGYDQQINRYVHRLPLSIPPAWYQKPMFFI